MKNLKVWCISSRDEVRMENIVPVMPGSRFEQAGFNLARQYENGPV